MRTANGFGITQNIKTMKTKRLAKKHGMTEEQFIKFCQNNGLLDENEIPTQLAIDLGFVEFTEIKNN